MFKTTRTRLNTSLQAFYSSMLSFSLFLQLLLSSPSPFISRSCYPYLHFPTLARCFVPLFRRFLLPSLTATLPNTGVHSWCWHPPPAPSLFSTNRTPSHSHASVLVVAPFVLYFGGLRPVQSQCFQFFLLISFKTTPVFPTCRRVAAPMFSFIWRG